MKKSLYHHHIFVVLLIITFCIKILYCSAITSQSLNHMPNNNNINIFWNSPYPMQCKHLPDDKKIHSAEYFNKFNIQANKNASFNGDTITTIYCPGKITNQNFTFGLWSYIDTSSKNNNNMPMPMNGGIPQRANLSKHLTLVTYAIEQLFQIQIMMELLLLIGKCGIHG